jgi:acetyl/propionyl-CoA carboxylase alpha subunit
VNARGGAGEREDDQGAATRGVYRQPDPNADPFVAERDRVQPGDVVGLVKIMKSFHEVKSEEGGMVDRVLQELGLASMAVYSQADADAFHVRKADQSTEIGKAAARHSYLNPQALLDAARSSGADAVSPGYGFVAENVTSQVAARPPG